MLKVEILGVFNRPLIELTINNEVFANCIYIKQITQLKSFVLYLNKHPTLVSGATEVPHVAYRGIGCLATMDYLPAEIGLRILVSVIMHNLKYNYKTNQFPNPYISMCF